MTWHNKIVIVFLWSIMMWCTKNNCRQDHYNLISFQIRATTLPIHNQIIGLLVKIMSFVTYWGEIEFSRAISWDVVGISEIVAASIFEIDSKLGRCSCSPQQEHIIETTSCGQPSLITCIEHSTIHSAHNLCPNLWCVHLSLFTPRQVSHSTVVARLVSLRASISLVPTYKIQHTFE